MYVGDDTPENERVDVWIDMDDAGNIFESPEFSGTPTSPTANIDTNTNQIATTAFVHNLINSSKGVFFVNGTQTGVTSAWLGELSGVVVLTDGLTINYRLPYNSTETNVTLALLTNGQLGTAVPVYYTGNTRMTDQYSAGSIIPLVYFNGAWYATGVRA